MFAITLPAALVIIAFFAASTHYLYYRGQRQMERFRADHKMMVSTMQEELRKQIRKEMEWDGKVAHAILEAAEAKETLPEGTEVEVMGRDANGWPSRVPVKVR